MLEELFVPTDVQTLLQNQPLVSDHDSWVWKYNRSGVYTVKTGYDLVFSLNKKELLRCHKEKPSLNPLKAQVWNMQASSKLKVFIWKALSGALSVVDALQDRGMKCDPVCQTCGMDGESINHFLFSCTLARQVWAYSGCPHPLGGFDASSLFVNVSYLFETWRNNEEMRWITKSNLKKKKAIEEANLWFLAQEVEQGENEEGSRVVATHPVDWIVPPREFVKCNIGMRWSKKKKEVGAVWVLSDPGGTTLLHSRRFFTGVWSKEEAYFLSLVWAVESLIFHKCQRVYFSLEWRMLVNAINSPKVWPSFKFKVSKTRRLFGELLEWRILFESSEANRGARLIANSVITGDRFQSYVARGSPRWLLNYFL
ncbi:hypothetical protein Bca52824_036342 [Brassica carinata]|uniref:Reverse transcriptase zinc-binding domain-containing protein n=1 Tax=Brassica carinata TaxID=52824 RepID=A0A8X7S4L2_BRACI|nr:hypothetical protein Bca52824_036342 [Brassica carinata]